MIDFVTIFKKVREPNFSCPNEGEEIVRFILHFPSNYSEDWGIIVSYEVWGCYRFEKVDDFVETLRLNIIASREKIGGSIMKGS